MLVGTSYAYLYLTVGLGCGRNVGMMDGILLMIACISGGVWIGRGRCCQYVNDDKCLDTSTALLGLSKEENVDEQFPQATVFYA